MGEVAVLPIVAAAPAAGGRVQRIALAKIDLGERLRPIDPDWAQALAVTMRREGILHRPEVRPLPGGRFRLVHGGHRLAAYRLNGWEDAEFEVRDQDALSARAREIAENVMRRELSPLHRAAFVAELYEVEKARAGWEEGETKQAFGIRKRWAKDTSAKIAQVSTLPDAVAQKVGLSARTIQYDLELFRALQPAVRALLAPFPIAENASQLRALAKLEPSLQAQVAERIAKGEIRTVAEGVGQARGVKVETEPQAIFLNRLIDIWSRLSAKSKRTWLRMIADHLPAGVHLVFDAAAKAVNTGPTHAEFCAFDAKIRAALGEAQHG